MSSSVLLENIIVSRSSKVRVENLSTAQRGLLLEIHFAPNQQIGAPSHTFGRRVRTVASLMRAGWIVLDHEQWLLSLSDIPEMPIRK